MDGDCAGLLGEIITAPLNVNAMTWRTSPAATELETVVIDWLRQWLGLPDQFDGVVYDTASVGIMHALAVAREEAALVHSKTRIDRCGRPVFRVYASDQAHSSVEKAAIALGLGEENVQRVPAGAEFRMDMAALRVMIERDLREKFKPLAVVATVGTTSAASVDPVRRLRKFAANTKCGCTSMALTAVGLRCCRNLNGWRKAGRKRIPSSSIRTRRFMFR